MVIIVHILKDELYNCTLFLFIFVTRRLNFTSQPMVTFSFTPFWRLSLLLTTRFSFSLPRFWHIVSPQGKAALFFRVSLLTSEIGLIWILWRVRQPQARQFITIALWKIGWFVFFKDLALIRVHQIQIFLLWNKESAWFFVTLHEASFFFRLESL